MSVSQTHITQPARVTAGRPAGQTAAHTPARPAGPAPLTRPAAQASALLGERAPGDRVGLTRDQVMTATEVAELLALPVSTVYYLARQGRLPASRLGRAYRFLRPALERLLEDGGW